MSYLVAQHVIFLTIRMLYLNNQFILRIYLLLTFMKKVFETQVKNYVSHD
jgi:hypothetical protein